MKDESWDLLFTKYDILHTIYERRILFPVLYRLYNHCYASKFKVVPHDIGIAKCWRKKDLCIGHRAFLSAVFAVSNGLRV
jgi:hypothetical protein